MTRREARHAAGPRAAGAHLQDLEHPRLQHARLRAARSRFGLLGSGKNSRLYKRLVYTDQIATSVSAGVGPFEIGSQLQVTATVKPGGDPQAVEKALDEEMAKFLREGPDGRGARAHHDRPAYASFVRGIERIDGSGGKSYILAQSQVFGGSPDFYKTYLKWVQRRHAEGRAGRCEAVAVRWRVRRERGADAGIQGGLHRRGSQQAARHRHAAGSESAAAAADDAVERPEGGARRASQRAGRGPHADRGCGICGGQPRHRRALRGSPSTCSTRARRSAIRCRLPSARSCSARGWVRAPRSTPPTSASTRSPRRWRIRWSCSATC